MDLKSKNNTKLEPFVHRAVDGDREALEALTAAIRDGIYNLAMYMLWHPQDAEDATQEILIRIITNLGSFREESKFTTWTYRIAVNYLLTARKRRSERNSLSFDAFADDLSKGLSSPPKEMKKPDRNLLEEEVKIGCTRGMLLCLDRPYRLAYILGEVFEVTSREGGELLDISPAAYRKRLSRARQKIRSFMQKHCGLVNSKAECRCHKRITPAMEKGRVNRDNLLFAAPHRLPKDHELNQHKEEMEELRETAAIFRSQSQYDAPEALTEAIREILDSDSYSILD